VSNLLKEGDNAPVITEKNFSELNKDHDIILYFYPKDDTPGCTIEAKDFSSLVKDFENIGIKIYGVSKDGEKSHNNFINKYDLKIDLIPDESKEICESYGVLKNKSMFGKEYIGIDRTTFFIKKGGEIKKIWRAVKSKDHAKNVLNYIKNLSS
jgi:peroxiredoxin Q/BCP